MRHDLYAHKVAEWSNSSHFTTKEFSSSKEQPLPFNAKEYHRGLTKAGCVITPYPKVPKKRRAEAAAATVVEKRIKLSEELAEPVVAIRSLPLPVDVNAGVDDVVEAASIEELLAGMDTSVDDITLTEMFLGEDSLDTIISGGDVDNYFSTEDTPASGDANHVENDVAGVSIKEEVVDDEVQFIKFWSQGDRETEERLVVSEARVGSLEVEVSRGLEDLDALKAEGMECISSLTAKCAGLKKEHEELKRVALGCETRLEESDKRYEKLVESMRKPGNHPMKREVRLDKAKADCK